MGQDPGLVAMRRTATVPLAIGTRPGTNEIVAFSAAGGAVSERVVWWMR